MYPPQPPQGPDQGGHDPYQQGQSANPYQQGVPGYSGYPGQPGPPVYPGVPQQPDRIPGAAITVRVLMFIGGVVGLVFGGFALVMGVAAGGEGAFAEEFAAGVEEGAGMPVDPASIVVLMLISGGIMFGYGLVSTVLASFMGKRSAAVLWGVVVFQVLVSLFLLVSVIFGGIASVVPLLFAIGMIVLMLIPASRDYYTSKPTTPYAGY